MTDVAARRLTAVADRSTVEPESTTFRAADGQYSLTVLDGTTEFILDRLRRDHKQELVGELEVRCALPGAQTYNGVLNVGTFNCSFPPARQAHARILADQSRAPKADWHGYLEMLCQRVTTAERRGEPAIVLSDLPTPAVDGQDYRVLGLCLPRDHVSVLFGDGGCLKSYLALRAAGELQGTGINVGFFDWEFEASAHRRRLEHLFGPLAMPRVRYARCERPLVHEVDRLRRIVRDEGMQYAIVDSIAFATRGAPESAESADEYFRAWRQLGIGGLHIAHVTKGENGDLKPFGSAFWHNGARSTWFIKRADATSDESRVSLGLYNRKANLGPLQPAVGLEVQFQDSATVFRRVDLAHVSDLATGLPLWRRIQSALKDGPQPLTVLAELLDAKPDTVKKTLSRGKEQLFTCLTNQADGVPRWALLERRAS